MIKFITDSSADIPAELMQEFDIRPVATHVIWGDQQYADRIDMQPDEFFQRIQSDPVIPTSSTPSIAEFQLAFDQAIRDGATQIVCMTVSAALSSTNMTAQQAARDYDIPIHVINSCSISMTAGWQLLAGARLAALGKSIDEVLRKIDEVRKSAIFIAGLDSFIWATRSGRLANLFRIINNAFPVKPIVSITTQQGKIEPVSLRRTYNSLKEGLLSSFLKLVPDLQNHRLAIMHANAHIHAMELKEKILRIAKPVELIVSSTGPVIGIHTGPKALAFCSARSLDLVRNTIPEYKARAPHRQRSTRRRGAIAGSKLAASDQFRLPAFP